HYFGALRRFRASRGGAARPELAPGRASPTRITRTCRRQGAPCASSPGAEAPMSLERALSIACIATLCLVAAEAGAQDCSKCRGFPTLCQDVQTCVRQCNVAPVQAQNCYQAARISLEQCKALYPQCKGD